MKADRHRARPARGGFPRDSGKEWSLVFSVRKALDEDWRFDGPEPDFFKWVDTALWVNCMQTEAMEVPENVTQEEREVWAAYHNALKAMARLLECRRHHPVFFRKVAAECRVLPSLLSWHPDAERANRALLRSSGLGSVTWQVPERLAAKHLAEQSWPVRYAYAVANTIDLTLETHGKNLAFWGMLYGYGVPHPVPPEEIEEALARMNPAPEKRAWLRQKHLGCYRILPGWTKSLKRGLQPLRPETVMAYWRIGKAMILEELPEFHLRPEWKEYRDRRHYAGGAKDGAVQHAIFRDILSALKTLAGGNRRRASSVRGTRV